MTPPIRTGQEVHRGEPHWVAFSDDDVRVYAVHPIEGEAVRLAEKRARQLAQEGSER